MRIFLYVLPFFLPAVHLIALDSQSGGELESLLLLHGLLAVQKWEEQKKRQARQRGREKQTERQKVREAREKWESEGQRSGHTIWQTDDLVWRSSSITALPKHSLLSSLCFFFYLPWTVWSKKKKLLYCLLQSIHCIIPNIYKNT